MLSTHKPDLQHHSCTSTLQVLSANPADVTGPLIMACMKPGDPYQLWFQDFWNQFGCSIRNGPLGRLDETCHIKSQAFVLINRATKQLVWAGEQGQPLTLAPYSMGSDADRTRRCTLFDQASSMLALLVVLASGRLCALL